MKSLASSLAALPYYVPPSFNALAHGGPKRKSLMRPKASNRFVLPIRQSFVMDARLMPGTTRMLTLLAGWAGHGRPIDTNLSVLARHLGRSVRQIQRYLRDAAEEGYLYSRQVTNRLGYVIGLRITLSKAAIFATPKQRSAAKAESSFPARDVGEYRRNQGATQESAINENIYILLDKQEPLDRKLLSLGSALGVPIEMR